MGFKETIEKQTNFLAEMYKSTMILRIVANTNAVFVGCLMIYMLLVGFGGYSLAIVFSLFLLNSSFYIANHITTKGVGIFK